MSEGESPSSRSKPIVIDAGNAAFSGITEIDEDTFSGYEKSEIAQVSIPDHIIKISDSAFKDWISLKNITIPNSITWIG